MLADDRALRRRKAVCLPVTEPATEPNAADDSHASVNELKTYVLGRFE